MVENRKYIFVLLIVSQFVHSIEEIHFELWRVFEPARIISGLLHSDLEIGFTIGNTVVVLAGILCSFYVFKYNGSGSKFVISSWAVVELINFFVHISMFVKTGGYFPGVYTAPLLLVFSSMLIIGLIQQLRQREII